MFKAGRFREMMVTWFARLRAIQTSVCPPDGSWTWKWKPRRVLVMLCVSTFCVLFMLLNTHTPPKRTAKNFIANISEFFQIKRDVFFNLHQYKYLLTSRVCERASVHTLVLVHSNPVFFKKRLAIRETLGSLGSVDGAVLSVVFMLGYVIDSDRQREVLQESRRFGDIVQGNYIDDYHNLTHKHVMTMHWTLKYCPGAKVIVKIDDDVIVNPYALMNYTRTTTFVSNVIHCDIVDTGTPGRDPSDKYHIPYEQYPFEILPEYCPGFAYITTQDVYRKLYLVSRDVRFIAMDDVFVTGILALKSNVKRVGIRDQEYNCIHSDKKIAFRELIFILNEKGRCWSDIRTIWSTLVEAHRRN